VFLFIDVRIEKFYFGQNFVELDFVNVLVHTGVLADFLE